MSEQTEVTQGDLLRRSVNPAVLRRTVLGMDGTTEEIEAFTDWLIGSLDGLTTVDVNDPYGKLVFDLETAALIWTKDYTTAAKATEAMKRRVRRYDIANPPADTLG